MPYRICLVCYTEPCPEKGSVITIKNRMSELDVHAFFQTYGIGGEVPEDRCQACYQLGSACPPEAYTKEGPTLVLVSAGTTMEAPSDGSLPEEGRDQ
jgi:hypothetical protein